jgi:hypothetical protein
MRERRRATIHELRVAVNCLPRATRVAMLEGINTNEIIVGAYTSDDGICPMLAAHRGGGRTNFISFAKAWDRFAYSDVRARSARRATERELLILRTHLEASLLDDEGPAPDLRAAIAEHRELSRRAPATAQPAQDPGARDRIGKGSRDARPGDADRSRELRSRPGWSWMRVVRRYDDYQRVLARLQAEQPAPRERQPVA